MATPQQIASQAGSANTAYQMQAARQSYGRKRKPKQVAQQENQALNGLQTTRRQRLENQAVIKATGRARRKKGGNYTAYGQTGGTLAPSGGGKGRAQVGDSHGVAIVRGDGVFGGGRKPRPVNPYGSDGPGVNRPGAYDLGDSYGVKGPKRPKKSGQGGLYVAPRKKGRKRGRPQYTSGGVFSTNV